MKMQDGTLTIEDDEVDRIKTWGKRGGIAIALVLILFLAGLSPVYNVPKGHKGVEFSKSDGVKEINHNEGWNFKIPFWETSDTISVRERTTLIDKTSSPTNERQEVNVTVLVTWRVNESDVWKLYKYIGIDTVETKLENAAATKIKAATVQRTIQQNLLDRQHDIMETEIHENLSQEMASFHVNITGIDIPNIQPDGRWIDANEDKVIAKENAIEAEHREREARAIANATDYKANGTARAIDQLDRELRESEHYITYLFVETWDGRMPRVVAGGGGSDVIDLLIPSPTATPRAGGSNATIAPTVGANGTLEGS